MLLKFMFHWFRLNTAEKENPLNVVSQPDQAGQVIFLFCFAHVH